MIWSGGSIDLLHFHPSLLFSNFESLVSILFHYPHKVVE